MYNDKGSRHQGVTQRGYVRNKNKMIQTFNVKVK